MNSVSGLLPVDKPAGPTSHDVVMKIRRWTRSRAGHTGTLDPGASGLLPVLLGRATRLARFMQSSDKEYRASILLGVITETFDLQGEVIERRPVPLFSDSALRDLLSEFQGEILQRVPLYSAVRVEGERLYKAAHRGEKRETPVRSIRIEECELEQYQDKEIQLRITCSAGTYIRSLAYDLGERLGCGASLSELRRLRSGSFRLESAASLEILEKDWLRYLLPLEELLTDFPRIDLSEEEGRRICHGNFVHEREEAFPAASEGERIRLFHHDRLIALGRVENSRLHPEIVLRPELFG